MLNRKLVLPILSMLIMTLFLSACAPESLDGQNGQETSQTEPVSNPSGQASDETDAQQNTVDPTTAAPENNDGVLVIMDFITPEDINAVLGIMPKGYTDYNTYSDNAWAYFDFGDRNDGMGLRLHAKLFTGDAALAGTAYPLVDDSEAARNAFEEVAIDGVRENLRITYYMDYEGEGFENKVEKNRDITLAMKKDGNVYQLQMIGPDHINYKQFLPELMALFVRNVESKQNAG